MKVKITSKRQATFPAALCRDLGLKPGDTIDLEAHAEEGRKYWVLRRSGEAERPWLGALKGYAPVAEPTPIIPAPGLVSGGIGGSGVGLMRWGAAR